MLAFLTAVVEWKEAGLSLTVCMTPLADRYEHSQLLLQKQHRTRCQVAAPSAIHQLQAPDTFARSHSSLNLLCVCAEHNAYCLKERCRDVTLHPRRRSIEGSEAHTAETVPGKAIVR